MSDNLNKERFNCAMDAVIHDLIHQEEEEEGKTVGNTTADLFTRKAIKDGLQKTHENIKHPENIVVAAFWTFYIRNKRYIYFFNEEEEGNAGSTA
jgi:hypothetical protein